MTSLTDKAQITYMLPVHSPESAPEHRSKPGRCLRPADPAVLLPWLWLLESAFCFVCSAPAVREHRDVSAKNCPSNQCYETCALEDVRWYIQQASIHTVAQQ